MTPQEVMENLLGRIACSEDGVAWFAAHEVQQWPTEAVHALKEQQLLKRSRDANTAVCDGCEEACVLPVQSVCNSSGEAISFLLCTLRSDTNRVMVDSSRLRQWRAGIERLCDFVAADLGINRSKAHQEDDSLYPIGLFQGKQRGQQLMLRMDTPLMLVSGDHSVPLLDLTDFEQDRYTLNRTIVSQLVDHANTADERYTPSTIRRKAGKLKTQERNERWQKEYHRLKRKNPKQSDVWISNQIARNQKLSEGKSSETIRKQMKK